MMALNAKLKRDGGSKHQTENMALKTKLRRYDDSKRQTVKG